MQAAVDVELVAAAQRGDQQAVEELLSHYLPLVYNVVGRALVGHPDVDDVVQETMLRVVQRLPDLRDLTRFRAWLMTITIRQVKERMRSSRQQWGRQASIEVPAERPDPTLDVAADVVGRVIQADVRRRFLAATRWLDVEDRQVLALWWQELNDVVSRAEIAEALSLSGPHTAVRIHRMKAQLAQAFMVEVALAVEPRCAGLAATASGWDGGCESRWLNRLGRHVRGCDLCGQVGRELFLPERHVLGIGLLAVPALGLPKLVGPGAAVLAGELGGSATVPALQVLRRVADSLSLKPVVAVAAPVVGAVAVLAIALLPAGPVDDSAQPPPAPVPTSSQGPAVRTPASAAVVSPSPSAPLSAGPRPPGREIFVSRAGDDSAVGSEVQPFFSLNKAVSVVRPGDTIYLRGGFHPISEPVVISVSGTPDQRITLTNYPGEVPSFDAGRISADEVFITHRASYWNVQGLDIFKGVRGAIRCRSCSHNVFRNLNLHDNRTAAFVLEGAGTSNNLIINSDFFDNADLPGAGADADGLRFASGSGGGNVVRGCRFFRNTDDGLTVEGFAGSVTIEASWAHDNAKGAVRGSGHGFHLGDGATAHTVTGSAAWNNDGHGFTAGGQRTIHRLSQNTAFRNAEYGFAFVSPARLRKNLALGNDRQVVLPSGAQPGGNSWDESGWSTDALREIDEDDAEVPRSSDGMLPKTDFLKNTRDPSVGAPMTPVR